MSKIVAIGKEPLHRLLESIPECVFRLKAEEFFGPADIQAPSRLSVGLAGVPYNLSCKAGLCSYHGGKIENRDFLPCSQIDGETSFIELSCAQDPFGTKVVQDSSGFSAAP